MLLLLIVVVLNFYQNMTCFSPCIYIHISLFYMRRNRKDSDKKNKMRNIEKKIDD